MRTPKVILLKKENYLAMTRNAARGENYMFQNLYASVDGNREDIVDGGALACSFFLSGLLYINKLIKDMHANMLGLEKDLEASGWIQVPELKEGAVVIWEPRPPIKERPFDPTQLHAGVYIGNDRVVSNDSNSALVPREFPTSYDGTRKIIRIWWHSALSEA
jgi:hypothetical protein